MMLEIKFLALEKALIQPAIILTESVVNVLKIKAIQKQKKTTNEENSVLHIFQKITRLKTQ